MPDPSNSGVEELRELRERCAQLQSTLESLVGVINRFEEARIPKQQSRPDRTGPRRAPQRRRFAPSPAARFGEFKRRPTVAWAPPRKAAPLASKRPGALLSRRPSHQSVMEFLIGERWLRRIGLIILLLGVVFLLRHAYDMGWLGPATLSILGSVAGITLVVIGHICLLSAWRTTGGVLMGFGVAAIYFVTGWAQSEHALFSPATALECTALTTVLLTSLAAWTRALGVLALAVLGAYAVPVAVAMGDASLALLTPYLWLATSATLLLVAWRRWEFLRIISWAGTAAVLIGWHFAHPDPNDTTLRLLAALFFYALFQIDSLLSLEREDQPPAWAIVPVIHLNNLGLFGAIVYLFYDPTSYTLSVFCLVAAISQWVAAGRIKALDALPRQIKRALRLDGAVLLACFAPIHFSGHLVTLLWAEQAVATAWFVRRLFGPWPAAYASGIIIAAMVRLVWQDYANEEMTHPWTIAYVFDFTWLIILSVVVTLCAYLTAALLTVGRTTGPWEKRLGKLLVGLATAIVMWMVVDGTDRYAASWWWMAFAALWAVAALRWPTAIVPALILTTASALKVFLWDTAGSMLDDSWTEVHGPILNRVVLTGALLVVLCLLVQPAIRRLPLHLSRLLTAPAWLTGLCMTAALAIAWIGTFEIVRIFSFEEVRQRYEGAGVTMNLVLSLFWGLSATLFLIFGLTRRIQGLRFLSIALFAVTLTKVLIVDFAFLETTLRIISFIALGVLMLFGSMLYHRLASRVFEPAPA